MFTKIIDEICAANMAKTPPDAPAKNTLGVIVELAKHPAITPDK